jgi:hypothetical protein
MGSGPFSFRNVLGSNVGQDTGYPETVHDFTQYIHESMGVVSYIRAKSLLFAFFPILSLRIFPSFDAL